jgi:hypothetical protein
MKLRAIGTGARFCRHPLIPTSWLIQTHGSNIVIGCPPQLPARLEALGVALESVDMIVPLNSSLSQIGGLDEFGHFFKDRAEKPYLACPGDLLGRVLGRIEYPHSFLTKAVMKVHVKEEHMSDTLTFVDNYSGGYGFRLEDAQVFVAGDAQVNEDWLFKEMGCELILHPFHEELLSLPMYLQNKIWLYGYSGALDGNDPLPMLFIPQGATIYDSDRRDKLMEKERFIRENSKRLLGAR